MDAKPLPCPWCGSQIESAEGFMHTTAPPTYRFSVVCPSTQCRASGPQVRGSNSAETAADAVVAWNGIAALYARVQALESEAQDRADDFCHYRALAKLLGAPREAFMPKDRDTWDGPMPPGWEDIEAFVDWANDDTQRSAEEETA